jgi:hypothetical protein
MSRCFGLGNCANLRTFFGAPRGHIRDLRRNHRPLALAYVLACVDRERHLSDGRTHGDSMTDAAISTMLDNAMLKDIASKKW